MAERRSHRQNEPIREFIGTKRLVAHLQRHVFGEVEMSKTQVSAAIALLKKTLPDLQAVEHTGANGGAIEIVSKHQRDAAVAAALRADA